MGKDAAGVGTGPKWAYDGSHNRFPVKPGEVWSVGKHTLGCFDLEVPGVERLLGYMTDPVDLAIVDPPYNAALASGYRTKANSMTPEIERRKVDFEHLIDNIVGTCSAAHADVLVVEMGVEKTEDVAGWMHASGFDVDRIANGTYYGDKPCCYLLSWAYHSEIQNVFWPELNGVDDADMPGVLMKALQPSTVFDPCCGRGLMAVEAEAAGATFFGNELNPVRMAVTLAKLWVLTGDNPTRIEEGRELV